MSHVLSRCVQLTSFASVAANIRQLWLLLPSIGYALNDVKPQLYSNSTIGTPDPIHFFTNTPAPTELETKLLLAPSITTLPALNEPLILLSKALSTHVNKYILLTSLYFTPNVFTAQLLQQFSQLLMTMPTVEIAQSYASEDVNRSSYLTTSQSAAYRISPENVNIHACYLWISILIAAKQSNTHFSYFLTNYGDILTILANTLPGDALHDGFLPNPDPSIPESGSVLSTVPGYNPNSKDYETLDPTTQPALLRGIITNSNLTFTPSFPPSMLYNNGFLLCPILDESGSICQSRTVISALPNPTQLLLLDLLLLFYHNELTLLPIKLQGLVSFNAISIQTVLIWTLFYLPRHQHVKGTVFNPVLMEILFMVIDLYLMANNEKESKYLDLFKAHFATIPTITTTIQVPNSTETNSTEMTDDASASTTTTATMTKSIIQDDITPAIIEKSNKIKEQYDKVTTYKVNFFSTIFALLYDWICDWPTLTTVLKTQSYARSESLQEAIKSTQKFDDDNDNDNDDDGQQELKRQRLTLTANESSIDDQLSKITLIYESEHSISKHVANLIAAILIKYKLNIRNISKDIVDHCNVPGLEPLMKQIFQ